MPATTSLTLDKDHPIFRKTISGAHGDLLIVQPVADDKKKTAATTIFIEAIRDVVTFMRHTPTESEWRVVVIDPAEAMNINAANALLKVLEEPPAKTLLILVSHQPGALLPTIRSRCRLLQLQPPGREATAKIMERFSSELSLAERDKLMLLAQHSPGLAMQWEQTKGLDYYRALTETFSQEADSQTLHALAQKSGSASAAEWHTQSALLVQFLYRLTLHACMPDQTPPLDEAEAACFRHLLSAQPLDYWLRLWDKANDLLHQVDDRNMDKKQTMLSLLNAINGSLQLA
jgi:DNA polymerase III subunit delta'